MTVQSCSKMAEIRQELYSSKKNVFAIIFLLITEISCLNVDIGNVIFMLH